MNLRSLAVAWFRKEDWPRWLAIDPDFQPDYDHWLKRAEQAMKDWNDPSTVLEKIMLDPDEFLDWSRVNAGGEVGQMARVHYANIALMKKHGTEH